MITEHTFPFSRIHVPLTWSQLYITFYCERCHVNENSREKGRLFLTPSLIKRLPSHCPNQLGHNEQVDFYGLPFYCLTGLSGSVVLPSWNFLAGVSRNLSHSYRFASNFVQSIANNVIQRQGFFAIARSLVYRRSWAKSPFVCFGTSLAARRNQKFVNFSL